MLIFVHPDSYAICDLEDAEFLLKKNWILSRGYAYSSAEPMHNYILPRKEHHYTLHLNGNLLDNRRCNLVQYQRERDDYRNFRAILELYGVDIETSPNYPEDYIMTDAEKEFARKVAPTKHACPQKRPKSVPLLDSRGTWYPSASAASKAMKGYSSLASHILRAVFRQRALYGMFWYVDKASISREELETFCANHNVNPDDLLDPQILP